MDRKAFLLRRCSGNHHEKPELIRVLLCKLDLHRISLVCRSSLYFCFSSSTHSLRGMASLSNLYPEGELATPPLAQPLRKPSLVPSVEDRDNDCVPFFGSTSSLSHRSAEETRRKRESYNLSGSTFLVTSSGKTLKLPVPSDSPADPLNWGRWKTIGAIVAVSCYSIVSLTVAQAASLLFHGILLEFDGQVRTT